MSDLLKGDLKNVRIPYREVNRFMGDMESEPVNSDNPHFYKDLNNTESFEDFFKAYDDQNDISFISKHDDGTK